MNQASAPFLSLISDISKLKRVTKQILTRLFFSRQPGPQPLASHFSLCRLAAGRDRRGDCMAQVKIAPNAFPVLTFKRKNRLRMADMDFVSHLAISGESIGAEIAQFRLERLEIGEFFRQAARFVRALPLTKPVLGPRTGSFLGNHHRMGVGRPTKPGCLDGSKERSL